MLFDYSIIITILLTAAVLSVKTERLSATAGVVGFMTGLLIYVGAGYTGIAMLAAFFLLGTGATSWGMARKQALGLAEKNKGRRTSGQVMANAGTAAILGLLVVAMQQHATILRLMMAASFASATADTLSSELGNLYGRRFYNIVTFKKDKRGLDGVVSLEGTIIGVAGSICIAIIYAAGFGFDKKLLLIIIAGTMGNLSDSIIGATLERKQYLNNNTVNFSNTAIAALAMLLLCHIT